jgi:hypothetical protein
MRSTLFAFLLMLFAIPLAAQELVLSELSETKLCTGSPILFELNAKGSFSDDNVFILQSSADNFQTFDNIGTFDGSRATITFTKEGLDLRFRAISTAPYFEGAPTNASIDVYQVPEAPYLSLWPKKALVGVPILIGYVPQASNGQQYNWQVENGKREMINNVTFELTFDKPGTHKIQLAVTNDGGCADTAISLFEVYTCEARIPKNAHVVTGTENYDPNNHYVWVKPGGKYTDASQVYSTNGSTIVFVEPGGTVIAKEQPAIFAKAGASVVVSDQSGYPTVIFNEGVSIQPQDRAQVLNCPDMQFDYSEVASSVDEERLKSELIVSVDQRAGKLSLTLPGTFDVKVIDVTGRTISNDQRMTENGIVDLSAAASGTYFVLVSRGSTTIARQIKR